MIANKEKSADKDKSICDYSELRRLRYFHGMLLDDKDFNAEQDYHTNKRRFLNRTLHGSGVVCGLDVNGEPKGRSIQITSGLALDCSGNEIWVPRPIPIDLAAILPCKEKSNQLECDEPAAGDDKVTSYWIGIRFDEKPSNPVSVYLPSGSCEERTCENSRWKEGFCIELLKECPKKTSPKPSLGLLEALCTCQTTPEFEKDYDPLCNDCGVLKDAALCKCKQLEKFCEQSVTCPECSCDKSCYVILGRIDVDKECRLKSICINDCRRYVLTGPMLQQMFVRVFAGAEKYLFMGDEPVKDVFASEMANNPIKALCWYLRHTLVEDGKLGWKLCGVKDKQGEEAAAQVARMRTDLDNLINKQPELIRSEVNKELKKIKINPLDKAGAVEPPKTRG